MSVVTSLGIELELFAENICRGLVNFTDIGKCFNKKIKTKIAGKISQNDMQHIQYNVENLCGNQFKKLITLPEVAHSIYCVQQIKKSLYGELPNNTGVLIGSGCGLISGLEDGYGNAYKNGKLSPLNILKGMANSICGIVSILFQLQGPSFVEQAACASSSIAIHNACRMIRGGEVCGCLCGGFDYPLHEMIFSSWDRMRVMSIETKQYPMGMRPFSIHRNGFILSEGTGFMLLMDKQEAEKRGFPIYAEICGSGVTSDARHLTYPQSETQMLCIQKAIKNSGIACNDIDYINAHGTATLVNDKVEVDSIKKALGEHAYNIPISSTKAMIGHMLGASGVVELIASICAMKRGQVHPTIEYIPDPSLDLFFVPDTSIKKDVSYMLKNTFGFCGINCCIVVKNSSTAHRSFHQNNRSM